MPAIAGDTRRHPGHACCAGGWCTQPPWSAGCVRAYNARVNQERFDPSDVRWMRQAIALSETALYVTSPNPRVACLVVQDGQLLASGVTQRAGGPHAEVMALRQAAERGVPLSGATLYVTLEPCSHHGRTPPCADAIVAARPARVVVAMTDPNPLVAGKGIARLRQAGIETVVGVCADEALEINPGFVARMTRARPWTWLKSAVSLDGCVALQNGVSQWITGPEARHDGHHWRARSCAVLTGIGTILADDPQLNVRGVQTPRQPLRVVLDSQLAMPLQARLLDGLDAPPHARGDHDAQPCTCHAAPASAQAADDAPPAGKGALASPGGVLILTCSDDPSRQAALHARGAQVVRLPATPEGRVDLAAAMRWLGEHAINEVHVEAGGTLSGALLQAGLIDELLVYTAPMLLGQGQPMARLPAWQTLDQAARYAFIDTQRMGDDLRLRLRRQDHWQLLRQAVLAHNATF